MEIIARAVDQPVAPRKVRLVLDAIRGHKINDAYNILDVLPHKSSRIVRNVLMSAVSNAQHNNGLSSVNLVVKKADSLRQESGSYYSSVSIHIFF